MSTAKKTSKEDQQKLEDFRLQVQEHELVARSNKAEFETMYYYLEARKIEKEFFEVRSKEIEDQNKQKENFLAQIQAQVDTQNAETPTPKTDEEV